MPEIVSKVNEPVPEIELKQKDSYGVDFSEEINLFSVLLMIFQVVVLVHLEPTPFQ